MSYQKDRDEFVGVIVAEVEQAIDRTRCGGSYQTAVDLARLILRNAATIQRGESDACNGGPAYDQDRMPCPASKSGRDEDCCCDFVGTVSKDGKHTMGRKHLDTPRAQVAILRAQQRIEVACKPWGIVPHFGDNSHGALVSLTMPSGRWNSMGGADDGYEVPTR